MQEGEDESINAYESPGEDDVHETATGDRPVPISCMRMGMIVFWSAVVGDAVSINRDQNPGQGLHHCKDVYIPLHDTGQKYM